MSLDQYLEAFEGVTREQAIAVLEHANGRSVATRGEGIFDNSVPRPLRDHLPGYEIATAFAMGWASLENEELLAAAEPGST